MAFMVTQLISGQVRIPPGPHDTQWEGLEGPAGGCDTVERGKPAPGSHAWLVCLCVRDTQTSERSYLHRTLFRGFEMGSVWHALRGYLCLSRELLYGKRP